MIPESGPRVGRQGDVEGGCRAVIQASELRARIMRYELADHEWAAIKPMLPNKPRGVPRVNDRRFSMASSGSCALGHRGATCPMHSVRTPHATTALFAGVERASG